MIPAASNPAFSAPDTGPTASHPAPAHGDSSSLTPDSCPLTPDSCPLTPSSLAPSPQPLAPSLPPISISLPDLPPLSPENTSLLARFAAVNFSQRRLAQELNQSITEVLAWTASDPIRPYIRQFRRSCDDCLRLLAAHARMDSIEILQTLALTVEDPVEKRRAAIGLYRAASLQSTRPEDTLPHHDDRADHGGINPDRKGGGTGAAPHTRGEGSSDAQDKAHRRTPLLESLLGPDGKIDRAKLAAAARAAQNDADDDQDLDDEADDNSDDDDESDNDQDLSRSSPALSSSPSSSSSRPSSSTPGLDSDDDNAPQSFDQAAALRPYETPQRLPEGAEDLPKPSNDLTHEQVIRTCMNALKNNDQPSPDAGIKTVFNFASTHNYVSIRRAHYDDFAAVFHRGPHQHLLNHDSYTIPPQVATGGYFGPHCCIHWWHVFVTKAGEEVEFEIGVCKIDNEPDLPLHIATLELPFSTRPFRPRPP